MEQSNVLSPLISFFAQACWSFIHPLPLRFIHAFLLSFFARMLYLIHSFLPTAYSPFMNFFIYVSSFFRSLILFSFFVHFLANIFTSINSFFLFIHSFFFYLNPSFMSSLLYSLTTFFFLSLSFPPSHNLISLPPSSMFRLQLHFLPSFLPPLFSFSLRFPPPLSSY